MSLVGNVYDGGSVRLEFLTTGAESDGALHEMRATYAPDSPLPPTHVHPAQDERFEIQAGALTFVIDGREQVVGAGQHVEVPRGTPHQVRNAGPVPAVAIWQTRPALRTAEFHDRLHATTAAEDWEGLAAALTEFDDVFRLA